MGPRKAGRTPVELKQGVKGAESCRHPQKRGGSFPVRSPRRGEENEGAEFGQVEVCLSYSKLGSPMLSWLFEG